MDGDVQSGAVSTSTQATETASTAPASGASSQEQATTQAPPLTVEAMQKILAEERETSRRAFQGIKDTLTAEVNKFRGEAALHAQKARAAEGSLQKVKQRFEEDPETQEKIELEELKAWKQTNAEQQQQWEQTQRVQAIEQQFYQDMGESLRTMGLDTNDKRIDWAVGVPDYKQRLMKIMASAKAILRQDTQVKEKKMEQGFKEEIAQLRKDLGIDKTTSSLAQGGAASDKEFRAKWGSGELPATKANWERAKKLEGQL